MMNFYTGGGSGGAALTFAGEASGAGVTAQSPCMCIAAPCDCAAFDQPPDISTLPIFGTSPNAQPIFRTQTDQLDWFRLVALAVGVLIGWKLLK